MGKPKKRTSNRKSGFRQSHDVKELGDKVNGILSQIGSKVKVYTTRRQSGKKVSTK